MPGRKAPVEPLVLITNDDFEWFYEWKDENGVSAPFPADHELYYQFKDGENGWVDGSKWPFTIAGSIASIRTESDIANAMLARTPYELVLKHVTDTPTKEKVLLMGNVERQEPRG